jgi:hypothetical protein
LDDWPKKLVAANALLIELILYPSIVAGISMDASPAYPDAVTLVAFPPLNV